MASLLNSPSPMKKIKNYTFNNKLSFENIPLINEQNIIFSSTLLIWEKLLKGTVPDEDPIYLQQAFQRQYQTDLKYQQHLVNVLGKFPIRTLVQQQCQCLR